MKNENHIFTDSGEQSWVPYGWSSMLRERPEDAQIFSGQVPMLQRTLPSYRTINANRLFIWQWLHDVFWGRFEWTPDIDNAGVNDYWISARGEWNADKKSIIKRDCEDGSLAMNEFAMESGINPEHLYLIGCIGRGGQSHNAQGKSPLILQDHMVAGLMAPDGKIYIWNSSMRRKCETMQESNLEFVHWHRCDWDDRDWRYITVSE